MKHTQKIPKTIHWCWLSGEPMPPFLQACMETWRRRLPDYTLKCWTQREFDIHSVKWVEQAVAERKWAFAADYIRLYALYTEGGIYLDSDVEVLKPFDKLLGYDFFAGQEYHPLRYKYDDIAIDPAGIPLDRDAFIDAYGIQAAIMGAAKGNSFVRECMTFYESHPFRDPDGTLHKELTMPLVMAKIAEGHGFRYIDKPQLLESAAGETNFIGSRALLPSAIHMLRLCTVAFHHCAGSWVDPELRNAPIIIGRGRLSRILKYTTKMQWWRFRKWKTKYFAGKRKDN